MVLMMSKLDHVHRPQCVRKFQFAHSGVDLEPLPRACYVWHR